MPRTDIHRPSAIQPTEYDFVCYDYLGSFPLGDWNYLATQRRYRAEHMALTGGRYSDHEHGGSCYVCGAHAIYTATFHHRPTNVYIRTGLDCAEHMEHVNADAFRRAVHDRREAYRGIHKAKETLFAKFDFTAANRIWGLFNAPDRTAFKYEEITIADIVARLVRYGSISDNALAYLTKLLTKIDERATTEAARAAERAAALPVPTGKQTIRGKVLSTKLVDGAFGTVLKMLVQHADGWKVYGTVPAAISDVKGKTVEFTATVTASNDDNKFGFFSRPTKARILEEA
jgi:hypothetical protein